MRACPLRPGRDICKQGFRKQMSKEQITVRGYVTAVPRGTDARQARVAIVQDDVEYRIIPRGAGVDLDDEVSVPVEVTGLLETAAPLLREPGLFAALLRTGRDVPASDGYAP